MAKNSNVARTYAAAVLQLAELAKWGCRPNPAVGAIACAVHAKTGEILVRRLGYTQAVGGEHAEKMALRRLRQALGQYAAKNVPNVPYRKILYVSLAPCTFYGKTPPCSDVIRSEQVEHVHIALADNDPRMGDMVAWLTQAGQTKVSYSFSRPQQRKLFALNEDYYFKKRTGYPLITIKYAMSLDGQLAAADGTSKWLTDVGARQDANAIRGICDAVLIGARTFLLDNPRLRTQFSPYLQSTIDLTQLLALEVNAANVVKHHRTGASGAYRQARERRLEEAPGLGRLSQIKKGLLGTDGAVTLRHPRPLIWFTRDFSAAEARQFRRLKYHLLAPYATKATKANHVGADLRKELSTARHGRGKRLGERENLGAMPSLTGNKGGGAAGNDFVRWREQFLPPVIIAHRDFKRLRTCLRSYAVEFHFIAGWEKKYHLGTGGVTGADVLGFREIIAELGEVYQLNSIFVEGGAHLSSLFRWSQLAARIIVYLASKVGRDDGKITTRPLAPLLPVGTYLGGRGEDKKTAAAIGAESAGGHFSDYFRGVSAPQFKKLGADMRILGYLDQYEVLRSLWHEVSV